MASSSTNNRIPVPKTPVMDPKTGFPTIPWYRYWLQPALNFIPTDGVVSIAQGGTGEITGQAAFNALAPAGSNGDMLIFEDGSWTVELASTTNIIEGSNLYFTAQRAEDAVGGILKNTGSITWSYLSGTSIKAQADLFYLMACQ